MLAICGVKWADRAWRLCGCLLLVVVLQALGCFVRFGGDVPDRNGWRVQTWDGISERWGSDAISYSSMSMHRSAGHVDWVVSMI